MFFLLTILCLSSISAFSEFQLHYTWQYINYTWTNPEDYQYAIDAHLYIPENNAMAGIKIYQDRLYIALPRIRTGVPITLGYISMVTSPELNPLITPFPSWELNEQYTCDSLQSVQSMEIDYYGVMWIIDGFRINNNTQNCPAKLILIDLNHNNTIVSSYVFPEEICSSSGGFLNDIVVDHSLQGDYAYITDNSASDPGLIVYSRRENRAWKLRDKTMFPEDEAINFKIKNAVFDKHVPIDGIALSPYSPHRNKSIYYCALSGFNLYSIETSIVKDEELINGGDWRRAIQLVGRKLGQSDGLAMDEDGNLFYGLLPLYGVGKWNIRKPFWETEIVDINRDFIEWPDSFAFDNKGNLFLLANNIHLFMDLSNKLRFTAQPKFRILSLFTVTRSYLAV